MYSKIKSNMFRLPSLLNDAFHCNINLEVNYVRLIFFCIDLQAYRYCLAQINVLLMQLHECFEGEATFR